MKINKIREMSSADLVKELGELKSELFKLRFSLATNGLDNPMKIGEVKKDIARINTILTERELAGEDIKEEVNKAKTSKSTVKKPAEKKVVKKEEKDEKKDKEDKKEKEVKDVKKEADKKKASKKKED